MSYSTQTALASAADMRRRELPAAVALAILTGGLAAAILGGAGGVAWAGAIALTLIIDAELYRRLDVAEARLEGRLLAGLAGWAFAMSALYAVLPTALWFNGEAAGAAAAMVLWVAGVARCFNGGAGRMVIALAGAAPPALALLISPLALAALSARPDWDLALIAVVGGGALMAYVVQVRLSAAFAGAPGIGAGEDAQQILTQLVLEQPGFAALLIDRDGRIVTMSRAIEDVSIAEAVGRRADTLCPWADVRWRTAFARALGGEHVVCGREGAASDCAPSWFAWEVLPWRTADGTIRGVLTHGREIAARASAPAMSAAQRRRVGLVIDDPLSAAAPIHPLAKTA